MLSSVVSSPIQKPLRLRRVNHSDEIVSGFSKLFKNESMTDVTLICNGGQTIRAHRVILSFFSPYFKAIFESQPFTNNQCQYPVIVIKDLAYTELRTIIEFIYKGEVSVSRDKLSSVLQAAKALEVSGLSELKVESFINSSNSSSLDQNNGNDGNSCISNDSDTNLASLNGNLGSLRSSLNIGIATENNGNNWKRGHESLDNIGSAGLDSSIKKSRIVLETGLDNDQGFSILGDNRLDGVKSLLQQPSRLSQGLQGLRSNALGFNQLQLNKQSSRHITVEQFLQQQQFQQRQQMLQQKLRAQQQQFKNQILQQQLLSKNSASKSRNGSSPQENNFLQFQEKIKAQILEKQKLGSNQSLLIQERLLQRQSGLKKPSKNGDKSDEKQGKKPMGDEEIIDTEEGDHDSAENASGQEDGDKGEVTENGKKYEESSSKGDEKDGEGNEDKEEFGEKRGNSDDGEGSVKEKKSGDDDSGDQDEIKDLSLKDSKDDESQEGKSKFKSESNGDEDEDDPKQLEIDQSGNETEDLSGYVNGEEMNEEEEEEYEVEIDKDLIFQRQQQLRLQQLQKQQQYQQIQLQHDQQEQKLLEMHRKLQQVNNAGGLPTEPDDPSANLSLDWQEGFVDDSFPNISTFNDDLLKNQERSLSIWIQAQNNGNNHRDFGTNQNNTSNSTNLTTPDFLQPRGPGRPRKGNKTQDISPCPECNKVFVRPDVLKLHYRSVHLNERHPCNMCPKIFKWPGDLSKHKRTKHREAYVPANANKNQAINVNNS